VVGLISGALVAFGSAPAGATTVSDAASFAAAYADPNETQISVAADITFSDCGVVEPTRASATALTIVGNGHTLVQACPNRRVLTLNGSGMLTLNGVTITGGNNAIFGGGIRTLGAVTLENSTSVAGNTSNGPGGGIFANGAVTVTDSTVIGNTATGAPPDGGGIAAHGAVTLTGSDVSGNNGGGTDSGGVTTLTNSTVLGNVGRGITATGAMTVRNSTLRFNSTEGMLGTSDVLVENSTVSGNGSIGVAGRNTQVRTSTVSDNRGGISGTHVEVENSTVTGNGESGGIFGDNFVQLINVTAAQNRGSVGANVSSQVVIHTFDSVIALAEGGVPNCSSPGKTVDGVNLFGDTSCGGQASPDPGLGPLDDNGGPTLTRLPQPGSPLIDKIPVGSCHVSTDQRGVTRPQGPACDIGAVEVEKPPGGAPPPPPGDGAGAGDGAGGATATGTGTGTGTGAAASVPAVPRFTG
jgi:predicted outer membrane repeat protein